MSTIDLSTLTIESAQTFVDKVFTITSEGNEYKLKLLEAAPIEIRARRRAKATAPKRAPFSLFFLGPVEPILPQGTYDLRGEDGSFEFLFIVPIGRDDEGTEYEAVFG